MNEKLSGQHGTNSSSMNIAVNITELWLNEFLRKQEVTIPLNDQYSLNNLKIELGEDKVSVEADIKEKENSSIKLDCVPIWQADEQQFIIQDIELKTDTNNLLIKSAGWFANTFMGSKLDTKIAKALNAVFASKREEFISSGLAIPIPDGKGFVKVQSIKLVDLRFETSEIAVNALLEGKLVISLGARDISN